MPNSGGNEVKQRAFWGLMNFFKHFECKNKQILSRRYYLLEQTNINVSATTGHRRSCHECVSQIFQGTYECPEHAAQHYQELRDL